MIVCVAGGAGFIGSHLCQKLLDLKHRVLCLDNLITGREENIESLNKNKNFFFLKKDITLKIKRTDLPSNFQKWDYLFHLASPASPIDYQNFPLETMMANGVGTLNLLELSLQNQSKFLLASTSEIYGDPIVHPQKENYWGNVNPVGKRACYDESKRYAEALTMVYIRKYKIDARIVRIFNTYGPKMKNNDGRVVSNFINQALLNKPITVYGQGKQTRSFCYVSDMVDGLIKAMFSNKTSGEVINLGNPDERTIIDFANLIRELTNSQSPIVYKNLPEDDPARRCPDIKKAQTILDWNPKVSLEEGLIKTIEYFRKSYV